MRVDIEIITEKTGSPMSIGTGHARITLHCVCNGEDKAQKKELHQENVTRNEFALSACICAMKELVYPCEVHISVNNPYVTASSGRIKEWHDNDWKRSGGKPVKNLKLWQQLYMLMEIHNVTFEKLEVEHENKND